MNHEASRATLLDLGASYAAAVLFRRPWLYSRAIDRAFNRTRGRLPQVAMDRLARLERMARRWRAKGVL